MNALPELGFTLVRANGEALVKKVVSNPEMAQVRLVQGTTIPSLKGSFVEVRMDSQLGAVGSHLLFEPSQQLKSSGIHSLESLVTVCEDGCMLVPMVNVQGASAELYGGMEVGVVSCVGDNGIAKSEDNDPVLQCAQVETIPKTPERLHSLIEALNLSSEKLSVEKQKQLRDLLDEFSDVFALSDAELGCTNLVKHSIDTGENRPFRRQPYRTPIVRREVISQMTEDMTKQGIIQPSMSPWASPVILVPKKDGSLRFCIDYRQLNSLTKKDVYPLPRIDDILDTLGEAKYFSSLDLASGYWQVELDEDARQKSAFSTHQGLFEFIRMPFGLCNAPATFQRLMQVVLAGLEGKICHVYLDDILILSKTFAEHLQHLKEVFMRLRNAGLRLKPKKCFLLRDEVAYLGHVVSAAGVKPDPAKVEKVRHYPNPTDVTKVRQFLGLASYYRKFIPGFARIAHPLTRLTKKDVKFEWTHECKDAFNLLKQCLITAPVLSYPLFGNGQEFILETDASGTGLGAVLAQKHNGEVHPIAYASRTLDPHEKNYGISELETLALVWAVRYFRPYLLGHRTIVYTDHSACTSLLNSPRPSGKLARWALTIQEMDLVIKHRSGKSNSNADALSRNPVSRMNAVETLVVDAEYDMSIPRPESEGMKKIKSSQREDPDVKALCDYVEKQVLPTDEKVARRIVLESEHYEVIQGVLHYEPSAFPGRLCVVVPRSLRDTLLQEGHASCFAGHLSTKKVYDRLRRHYWWKGMRADVHKFCRKCLVCASRKGPGHAVRPPLVPIPVGGPFHRLGVDVLQLPVTHSGNRYVVCFLDYLTKWAEAFAVPDQRAETIARLFVENVVCRHGIPEQLLSDRGTNFLSDLIKSVCDILGVKKINTSGYHPQTDGLVEKFNSTLTNMIAKCCDIQKRDWDEHLPYLLFAYRSMVQESTCESPFCLLYGRDPRVPTETVLSAPSSIYAVDIDDYKSEMMTKMSRAWEVARSKIEGAQNSQKIQYDHHAKKSEVRAGDRVMVFMPSEVQGKERKLARPYHGPYRVLKATPTNVEVTLIDCPEDPSIFVSLSRVRRCYDEMDDVSWTGPRKKRKRKIRAQTTSTHTEVHQESRVEAPSPVNPESSPQRELMPTRNSPITRSMTRAQNKS